MFGDSNFSLYFCTRKHQEQSSSDGLTNRASSECRSKLVYILPSRERGRAIAQPSYSISATVVSTMWEIYSLQKQKVMQQHIYYIRYALQFADMQIPELVTVFNAQMQNRGWSSMRAYHDQALIDEFRRRGIDVSAVYDGNVISFAYPIRYDLPDNKLIAIG